MGGWEGMIEEGIWGGEMTLKTFVKRLMQAS